MRDISVMLQSLREERKLKQSELGELLGTTQQQYSNYERKESDLPLYALHTLADFYGVSADYIMGRTDCREGVEAQNQKILDDYSVGEMISDMLSLNETGRIVIREQIKYQKEKNPK